MMDRSDTAYLIGKDFVPDAYGVQHAIPSERLVFVSVQSVTLSEWSEGGRQGLNPELRFTMFRYDYQGEEDIRYGNQIYRIYRTYIAKNDVIELYAEKRKGHE